MSNSFEYKDTIENSPKQDFFVILKKTKMLSIFIFTIMEQEIIYKPFIGKNFSKSEDKILIIINNVDALKSFKEKASKYKSYCHYLANKLEFPESDDSDKKKCNIFETYNITQNDIALYNYMYDCSKSVKLHKLKGPDLSRYNEEFKNQILTIKPKTIIFVGAEVERIIRRQALKDFTGKKLKLDDFLSNLGVEIAKINRDGKESTLQKKSYLYELNISLYDIKYELSFLRRIFFPETKDRTTRKKLRAFYKESKKIYQEFLNTIQSRNKVNDTLIDFTFPTLSMESLEKKIAETYQSEFTKQKTALNPKLLENKVLDIYKSELVKYSSLHDSNRLEKKLKKTYPIEFNKCETSLKKLQSQSGFSKNYLEKYLRFQSVIDALDKIIERTEDKLPKSTDSFDGERIILNMLNEAECFVPLPMFIQIAETVKENLHKTCDFLNLDETCNLFKYYIDYYTGKANRITIFNNKFKEENKNKDIAKWDKECDKKIQTLYNKLKEEDDDNEDYLKIMTERLFHVKNIQEMEIKQEGNVPSICNDPKRITLLTNKDRDSIRLWSPKNAKQKLR